MISLKTTAEDDREHRATVHVACDEAATVMAEHLASIGVDVRMHVTSNLVSLSAHFVDAAIGDVHIVAHDAVVLKKGGSDDLRRAITGLVEQAWLAIMTRAHLPWLDHHFYDCKYRSGEPCSRGCMEA